MIEWWLNSRHNEISLRNHNFKLGRFNMKQIKKITSFTVMKVMPLLAVMLLPACGSSDGETIIDPELEPDVTLEDGTKLTGLPKDKTRSLFTAETSTSSEQYIRNYLIKQYSQTIEYEEYIYASQPVADEVAESAGDSSNTISSTNTIEENVDEADFIKTFSANGQDYLVTVTQAETDYSYSYDEDLVEEYKQETTPAALNLFSLDTSPASSLINSLSLNEDAYHVSGIYSYQGTDSTDVTEQQIIAQTSLWEAPSDWLNYQAWRHGRTGIIAAQISDLTLRDSWSIVFDGHIVDSRRIDNHMYVALRHNNYVDGLERPYYGQDQEAVIANNLVIIEQLDIPAMLPSITVKNAGETNTSPAFSLESCQLPNNDDRFSSGSVVFNYVAKINLDSGSIDNIQCVLSEINQLYMSETSLFLIDANDWADQTSRLHRFELTDLSYDTSLTIDGTLGWRSAEFRIKELADGTVVTVTSKPEYAETENWCCFFNRNWEHKLQLFQKDETENYAKIAELPNELQPDNDDTPQSLGKEGEDIYGVRIDENSVKVVTFRQTDPLYVFDITDRTAPTYSGELADTGFSAYLHTFDELILGIGFDANEWGNRKGLKVELYKADSAVDAGIVTLDEYIFGDYAYTPVDSDYHAFSSLAVNDITTRIAFPAIIYSDEEENYSGLMLFTLDNETQSLTFNRTIKADSYNRWYSNDRSVIQHSEAGDVVHYITDGEVISELWDEVE